MEHIMNHDTLKAELTKTRLKAYMDLRGGFSLPLAGATYWFALGVLGYKFSLETWTPIALFGSGVIFPIGLLYAKMFKNDFMKYKQVVGNVLLPAFIGMLLFWPMLIAAMQTAPELAPLILAIGMSSHWPIVGWMYGRVGIYSAHSILRALVVLGIWVYLPDARITLLPLAVAVIYLMTVVAILMDSGKLRKKDEAKLVSL